MRIVLLSLILFMSPGCGANNSVPQEEATTENTKKPTVDSALRFENGQKVELTGIAEILPDHCNKANCQGIVVGDQSLLFKGEYKKLPKEVLGKSIHVTGTIRQGRLPMFHATKDGPIITGIPVPPDTDIEKASIYFMIESPTWEVLQR